MPLLTNTITRRGALKTVAGAAIAALPSPAAASGFRWALLSDTHLSAEIANEYRGFRPYDNLRSVLPEVSQWKPEGMFINGDLARLEGLPGDYGLLKKQLEPLGNLPAGFTLGNHDDRTQFLAAFGASESGKAQPVRDKHVVILDHGGLRLILLDSLYLVNQGAGLLGKTQREWLDGFLVNSGDTPVLLFVHHTLDDGDISMLDADRFLRIATKHRNVKAVFYGHSHHYGYQEVEGLHLVNQPAVGYNFADSEPVGWLQATLSPQGADFTLRAIGGNREGHDKTRSLAWRS
ncbi:MAG: metallophosphoesterase [Bryobacteraceae bacterium]